MPFIHSLYIPGWKYDMTIDGYLASPQRAFNGALRSGMYRLAYTWAKEMLPKHFTNKAFHEYGYTPRNRRYMRYKIRKMGHSDYIKFSGTTRLLALSTAKVRATSARASVTFRVPFYIPPENRKNQKIDMRNELTTVTQAEADRLGTVCRNEVVKHMQRFRAKKRAVRP